MVGCEGGKKKGDKRRQRVKGVRKKNEESKNEGKGKMSQTVATAHRNSQL